MSDFSLPVETAMSKVLLVEDFEPLRTSTAAVLRQMGFTVVEADSAESAMAVLAAEHIDVLFTDISLPGVSGEVFAAEARVLHPSLQLVFGTGLAQFPSPAHGSGPPLLRKPYTRAELEAALAPL